MIIKGFTAGAFDLLHAGHVDMLRQARNNCDYLIVGLHTDPTIDRPEKNKPIQSVYERYLQLSACKYVDKIIPYDTEEDLYNLLNTQSINIRFIGSDYKYKSFTGDNLCEELGIKIFFNNRNHNYSTTSLRKRIENAKTI